MDAHSLRVLEFPDILAHLAAQAGSILGRQRAEALLPAIDPALVNQRLAETRECRDLLRQGSTPGLEEASDIRAAVQRATVPGVRLAPPELLAVAGTLEAADRLRRHLRSGEATRPHLARLIAGLRPPSELAAEIRRCVMPDGVLADGASPELFRLRGQARRAREAAREALQSILTASRFQPIIAEPVITLRNDRYVIPVTSAYRGVLPGVVQDQSGSGHTLFLEPLAVVELNNAIRRLEREAEAEADRILEELTGRVRAAASDVADTVEALADADLLLAKARLAERWDAAEPEVRAGGVLRLRRIRHPLLLEARRARRLEAGAGEVVPIDVDLPPAVRVLVVTGPNTGGKTVALKTVGLAALMAQAGLHLPASGDSQLPLFSRVFADIGDEQSIAEDLSTFSAHVTRLRLILDQATGQSLVLVDEIGAGTDPGEGAALGGAILEALAGRGCHVLATTHLDGIKAFVAQDARMVNGNVEFDLDRLRPAYTLHIGSPGRSFAIDIACRLGIPPMIVERARELMGDSGAGIAALLDRLEALDRQRTTDAGEVAREREAAARARQSAEARAEELRAQAASIRTRASRLVEDIASETRRQAERIVADLRRGGSIQEARRQIRDLAEMSEAAVAEVAQVAPPPETGPGLRTVVPGQRVLVQHLGQVGTVLSEPTPQGLVEVQLPLGKTRADVQSLRPAAEEAPRPRGGVTWTAGAGDSLTAEIKVIGCTVEEATERVRRYLEDAVLGGLQRVRIVHGKGTGRLRRGLAEALKNHPLVASFHLAAFDEGGAGATVVELGPRESASEGAEGPVPGRPGAA